MSDEAVYRTAPATPGLLTTKKKKIKLLKLLKKKLLETTKNN